MVRNPDVFDERFVIEERVGSGALGSVFRARDLVTGSTVALKVFRAHCFDESMRRFQREADRVIAVDHPHLVRAFARTTHAGEEALLAMEWLDAERLSDRLRRRELTLREAVGIARGVAGALGALHARGLVHCNIKPENLFLIGGDPGRVKLSDPRIIAVVPSGPHRELPQVNSVGYWAPEFMRLDEADARADVFGLGAVLFRCLAGCAAFPGEKSWDVANNVAAPEAAPRVSTVRPEVPQALCDLVAAMLEKKKERRPADGAAVARALADIGGLDGGGASRPRAGVELPEPSALKLSPPKPSAPKLSPPKSPPKSPPRPSPKPSPSAAPPSEPLPAAAPAGRTPELCEHIPHLDAALRGELLALVLPRCADKKAHDKLSSILGGHCTRDVSGGFACVLCGRASIAYEQFSRKYLGPSFTEIRPEGFRHLPPDNSVPAREPALCDYCVHEPWAAIRATIEETLAALEGDDEALDGGSGSSRRVLREALLHARREAYPDVGADGQCGICGRKGPVLHGARMDVCIPCMSAARASFRAWFDSAAQRDEERVRSVYTECLTKAEARLRRAGRRLVERRRPVELPPRLSSTHGVDIYLRLPSALSDGSRASPLAAHEVDVVARRLAELLESHAVAAARGCDSELDKRKGAALGDGVLPELVAGFLGRYRPGPEALLRLELAIVILSEVLNTGVELWGMGDEGYEDITPHFHLLHGFYP
jgi:serine/threonine protein kinase